MLCPLWATLKRASAGAAIPALLFTLILSVFFVFLVPFAGADIIRGDTQLSCDGEWGITDINCAYSQASTRCDNYASPIGIYFKSHGQTAASINGNYTATLTQEGRTSDVTPYPNPSEMNFAIISMPAPNLCFDYSTNRWKTFNEYTAVSGTIVFKLKSQACTIDLQCDDGDICKEGKCSGCTKDSDCGVTGSCMGGKCDYTCSDGTAAGQCSTSSKPFYCSKGNLIPLCLICGCDEGFSCIGDTTCSMPGRLTITDMVLNKNPAITTLNSFRRSVDIISSGNHMDGVYAIVEVTNSMGKQTSGYFDVKAYYGGEMVYTSLGDEMMAITLEPNSKGEIMIPLRADKMGAWTYDIILKDSALFGIVIDTAVAHLDVLDEGSSSFNGPKAYGASIAYEENTEKTNLTNEEVLIWSACIGINILGDFIKMRYQVPRESPESGSVESPLEGEMINCEMLAGPNVRHALEGNPIKQLRETAIVHLNTGHMGSYRELNISWSNLNCLDTHDVVCPLLNVYYDRAVVLLSLPSNVKVLDDANADYNAVNETTQKRTLMWIYNGADKSIKSKYSVSRSLEIDDKGILKNPNGLIGIKLDDSNAGVYEVTANLELQIGPFKAPIEIIHSNIRASPFIYDYAKWNSKPEQVYWYSLGYDEESTQIQPPVTLPVMPNPGSPSSGGGGGSSTPKPTTNPVVPTTPIVQNPVLSPKITAPALPVSSKPGLFDSLTYLFGNTNSKSTPAPKATNSITGSVITNTLDKSGGIIASAVNGAVKSVVSAVSSAVKGFLGFFGVH